LPLLQPQRRPRPQRDRPRRHHPTRRRPRRRHLRPRPQARPPRRRADPHPGPQAARQEGRPRTPRAPHAPREDGRHRHPHRPTGTFKTETGKQLALTTDARLVTLKGAAGIEDRDFWGSIVPTEHGPKWVDGPLTKAFRSAQKNKTVLLIDELLRFEPLYANVLVGA